MKYKEPENCNRCAAKNCKGLSVTPLGCAKWISPTGSFMLAELALAHATSLNEALSALPFEANLNFYLK